MLLLEPLGDGRWEALAPAHAPAAARDAARARSSWRSTWATGAGGSASTGEPAGEAPLPPYITEPLADPERYQTVYAEPEGSAAAPTAGLHFTPELLARLDVARVTLHVGLDTFRPVVGADARRSTRSAASATQSSRPSGSGSPPRRAYSRWGRRPRASSSRSRAARRSPGAPTC